MPGARTGRNFARVQRRLIEEAEVLTPQAVTAWIERSRLAVALLRLYVLGDVLGHRPKLACGDGVGPFGRGFFLRIRNLYTHNEARTSGGPRLRSPRSACSHGRSTTDARELHSAGSIRKRSRRKEAMVKLIVLFGQPQDASAFEDHWTSQHVPLVQKIPNVRQVESARVTGTPDGSEPPYHRIAELSFDSVDEMQAAVGSAEGQAAVGDLQNFATGGVTILVAETG